MCSETGSKLEGGHMFGLERAAFKWYFRHMAGKAGVKWPDED